jgi:hypothetical protein
MRPWQESNLHFSLRRGVSYPLNDKSMFKNTNIKTVFSKIFEVGIKNPNTPSLYVMMALAFLSLLETLGERRLLHPRHHHELG